MLPTSLTRCLAVALALSSPVTHAADDLLEGYTWQNRLLLIFAPSEEDSRLRQQQEILASSTDGLLDRDLVILRLLPDSEPSIDNQPARGVDSASVYRDFAVEPGDFRLLLLGKDGTLKLSSDSPVPSARLFDLIDSMPMRQWEMQNQD